MKLRTKVYGFAWRSHVVVGALFVVVSAGRGQRSAILPDSILAPVIESFDTTMSVYGRFQIAANESYAHDALRIEFKPGTTSAQMRAAFDSENAHIVGFYKHVYFVRIAPVEDLAALHVVINRLGHRPEVLSVGPIMVFTTGDSRIQ